jgi:SAM-dependent methyltransferase
MGNSRKTIYQALGREPVHPFPARMAPEVVLGIIPEAGKPLRVLDPMMGSGTVIALAQSKGHGATGIDIDPLAVLISRVWTTALDAAEVRAAAAEVLGSARGKYPKLSAREAFPLDADDETKGFVRFWFDGRARRQLAALARSIADVPNAAVRDALWCAFSRLIITKRSGASLAMDISHSRPHRAFSRAPVNPFEKFLAAADRVASNCVDKRNCSRGPAADIREGDARRIPLGDATVDVVLTSPPYLNAIDYIRCSKFSLVWMGYTTSELRRLRAGGVGAEARREAIMGDPEIGQIASKMSLRPALGPREEGLLWRYIDDMRVALREASRVLAPGGRAVYVVGDNTIKGTFIRNSVVVSAAAELAGLRVARRQSRDLPANRRYLPPPSKDRVAAMDGRMRREVVLTFTKPP